MRLLHVSGNVFTAPQPGWRRTRNRVQSTHRLPPHLPMQPSSAVADAAVDFQPLTKEDLVQYLADGCKPKSKWRIGTEHEKLGFSLATGKRMNYAQIQELLLKLQERYAISKFSRNPRTSMRQVLSGDRFGWQPVTEGEYIIGLHMDGQNISLEPGGQFELSGAPLETLHQTCAEVNNHLYQAKTIMEDMGVYFLGLGFDPISTHDDVPVMPKQRYQLMRNYMPTRGDLGLHMMFRSCTIQVNLDFESEQDMVEKFQLGLALQPIATALFANSPFVERQKTGYLSWRSHVWTDTDPDRCGHLPFVFESAFGFERYVEYALDVPMYFVYRKGTYINALGQSFRDFMQGKLPALPGEYPTLKDWEAHLTTIFPEVRLKRFLEMRGADGGPFWRICSLPAMWVGLLYDAAAQDQALQLIKGWSNDDIQYLRDAVPVSGLQTPFKGSTVQRIAQDMLQISSEGLIARGYDESSFLHELMETACSGLTLADKLVTKFDGEWQGDITRVLQEKRM